MNNNGNPAGLLCMLVVVVAIVAVVITIWWKIWDKTGYGGALSLLMLIPFVNFIMLQGPGVRRLAGPAGGAPAAEGTGGAR